MEPDIRLQGLNIVTVMGRVAQSPILTFTDNGREVFKFTLMVERITEDGKSIKAFVKCNIYNKELIAATKDILKKNMYALAVGELMTWPSGDGRDNMEVRVREIRIFGTLQ